MKKILLALLLTATASLANSYFTKNQLNMLEKIKHYAKPYNLQNTLMAIAYVESDLGKYLVDVDKQKYGVFKVQVESMIKHHHIKETPNNKNLIAQKLIMDFEFNITCAIEEILFWKSIYGENDWMKIWASYNSKENYDSTNGKEYAREIAKTISLLRELKIVK